MAWFAGLMFVAMVGLAACSDQSGSLGGCGESVDGASAACSHGPTAAPGGLSQDAAIAAAREVAPSASGDVTVVWASIENDPFTEPGTGDQPLVWEVRLEAAFAVSPCPSGLLDVGPTPSDPACMDQDAGLVAVLDYRSGKLLGWTH